MREISPRILNLAPSDRRVQLAYEVDTPARKESVELPFVIGVLADLAGQSSATPNRADREFLEIERDAFDRRMKEITPRLALTVASADGRSDPLLVELTFECMSDFEPDAVARRVRPSIPPEQLDAILRHQEFRALESAWRGLRYLVTHGHEDRMLKIRFACLGKGELADALADGNSSHGWLRDAIGERPYAMSGGEPFGCLIGDYYFDHGDAALLTCLADVAAAAHAPFIGGAAPTLLGLSSWQALASLPDTAIDPDGPRDSTWRTLRASDHSRFIALALPRCLATVSSEGRRSADTSDHGWMNAVYVMGANLARSFAHHRWFARIRGAESGGAVDDLPTHALPLDDGTVDSGGQTEIGIGERWGRKLVRLGLMPLERVDGASAAAFIDARSIHQPPDTEDPDDRFDAALGARLPYLFASCRFAQYLKCFARDHAGVFADQSELEHELMRWTLYQMDGDPHHSSESVKCRLPIAGAAITLSPPDERGVCCAEFLLRPTYQLEGLRKGIRITSSVKLRKHV